MRKIQHIIHDGLLGRATMKVIVILVLLLGGTGNALAQTYDTYDLRWSNLPAGQTGRLTYKGTEYTSADHTITVVGSNMIGRSEIEPKDIVVGNVTYRGAVSVDNTQNPRTITITYAQLPQNQFTVRVQTVTTTNLGAVVYNGDNYVHGSTLTFDSGVTSSTVAAALDAGGKQKTINGTPYDHIINADDITQYADIMIAGSDGNPHKLSATHYENYYVQMTVEGQTISIRYIGNAKPATITYEIYYDGEYQFSRVVQGYVGQPYPRVDKDFDGMGGPYSTLPYGVKVTNYPSTVVMGDATVQLQTEYVYTTIPFYPADTRFTKINTWYAASIGVATIDPTPVVSPDRTTPEYLAKHAGVYYFYNNNGTLAIDKNLMVKQETEYWTLDGMEAGYAWAMLGSPYKFRLMNKLAGAGKYLKWNEDGQGGGFFTFDEEGTYFVITYNYSLRPGDYGWAGYLPDYDISAMGLNGYPPFSFGCSVMLREQVLDNEGRFLNQVLSITRDAGNNAESITIVPASMHADMNTPGFTSDDVTMRKDCHVYMGTLSSELASMTYTVRVEVADGSPLAGTGITYGGEDHPEGAQLTFKNPPSYSDFVSLDVDGYEGLVSMDHAKHEIVVTYLRKDDSDYFYVRNTMDWAGFLVDGTAAGYFTPDPRSAAMVYPVPTGATSGIVRGVAYTDVETFYIYERGGGYYWTDEDVSFNQNYADRYVFIDKDGVPVTRAELMAGKNVAIVNVDDFMQGRDLSTIIPYSIYGSVESELQVGELKSEWQFLKYRAPKPVTVSIYHSNELGVRTPLNSVTIRYGKETLTNGSTLYTIEEGDRLPGLIIPVMNPASENPSLYAYNLNVAGGSLNIIYQNAKRLTSADELVTTLIANSNSFFGLYNISGKGFVVYDEDNNVNHAQVQGAWDVDGSDMAKDAYSQPIRLFDGYGTWQVEVDFAADGVTPIAFYLRNAPTGYYCAENADGSYTFSTMRSPVRIVDLFPDYFQAEANANNTSTRAGVDLSDSRSSIKTMTPGPATQFALVIPSQHTIYYTVRSNLKQGGVILRTTNTGYGINNTLFYTIPITDANKELFLQAAAVPGYTSTLEVNTDMATHTGIITVTYHADVDDASQPYLVHGGSDFAEKNQYWSSSTTSAVLGSTITPMQYQMISFEEAPTALTQDYTVAYGGAETATLTAGTKTYYMKAAYNGVATTYGKYIGFNNNANPTAVSPAAFTYKDVKDMPVVLFEVPGHPNQYYFIPVASLNASGNSTLAMVWTAGHASGAAMALGTMNVSEPGVTSPFEMEPSLAVNYDIVITGCNEGRISVGAVEYEHGQVLNSRRILTSDNVRVKPVDGYHYTYRVTGSTIEASYVRHNLATSVDDLKPGVLYTLRTTTETEGHTTHGYYTSDNVCVGDYDDINEHGVNYIEPQYLWQIVRVGDDIYSWSEQLGHAVGVSLPVSLANTYMADGTWKFEETEMTTVAPYFTIDFINYPTRVREALGNPAQDSLRVVLSSQLHETWTPAATPFDINAKGHGEGVFLELANNMAAPVLQYNDGGTWRDMDATKARALGFYWPIEIARVTNSYFLTFTETLEHLQQRADTLVHSENIGKYFYPVSAEYEALSNAVESLLSLPDDGIDDPTTKNARQTMTEALAHFVRPDVPVTWPDENQLIYITNYQSGSALYHKYGDPLSRLKNPDNEGNIPEGYPTAYWSFEHVDGHHYRLHNANGDITDVNCFTAFEMGHAEWPGSLFNIHLASDGVFFDPLADIIEIDPGTGGLGAGSFTPEKDLRYSLLSNLIDSYSFTHEQMADMPNAYWGTKDAILPANHTLYKVEVSGVPEGVEEQPLVHCTDVVSTPEHPAHTVEYSYESGFFVLDDTEYSNGVNWTNSDGIDGDKFTATDYGHGSSYTITLDQTHGILRVEYTLGDYYWQKLQEEMLMAKALYDEPTAQSVSSEMHADPMTYGYPTVTARQTLGGVVTPIENMLTTHAGNKAYVTANIYNENSNLLTTAVNNYNSTTDVITPGEYDVILVRGIIDNGPVNNYVVRQVSGFLLGSRQLRGDRPTVLDDDPQSGGDYRNYWVLRASDMDGFYYLQSGYGDKVYLNATGISDVPQPWHFANGTVKGRLSMYYYDVENSRFVETGYGVDGAGNVTDRMMGGTYSSNQKRQLEDRSTDFGVEQMLCTPLFLKVEGADGATLAMVKDSFKGKRFINDGEMLVQQSAFVQGLVATVGSNKVPATLLAEYLTPTHVDGMTPYFSYDAGSHVLTLSYEEDIEPYRERMFAYIYNAQFMSLVPDADRTSIITNATVAVSNASSVDQIKVAMRAFFKSIENIPFTLQNKATSYYLNSLGGASLMPTATASSNSQYVLIYVGDGSTPTYLLHNITLGNYVAAITATRMVSTTSQDLAGQFDMYSLERGAQNYVYFTCTNGLQALGNVMGHEAAGSDVTAMTSASVTDNMLWGVHSETSSLPVTGNYYYLPDTATPLSTADLDNPAQMCQVTRSGSLVVVRPLNAQNATYTLTLTEAQAKTWTPVALPGDEYLAEEYTKLLELYYMGTMPVLGAEIGQYSDPNAGQTIDLTNSIANAVTALKTNKGAQSFYNTEQGSSAYSQLGGAIRSLQLNMPPTGFYRIRNAATGRYLSTKGFINDVVCPVASIADDEKENDAHSIFYFESVSSPDANNMVTCRLLNYANGQYLYATNVVCYPEFQTDAHRFTIRFHAGTVGCYAFWYADTREFLSCGTAYSAVMKCENVNDAAATTTLLANEAGWYLEKVNSLPVTVGKAGYASLYVPANVTVPSGLTNVGKAYNVPAGTLPAVAELNLTNIVAGSTIPAGTPVIIQANEGTYKFAIQGYPASLTPTATAGLKGLLPTTPKETVEKEIQSNQNIYVMMKGKVNGADQVGFFKDYIGNLNGFKAYLEYPASSPVKTFLFHFQDEDAVLSPEMMDEQGLVYDLNGVRVGDSTRGLRRGLYIQNGKKITVR